MTGVLIRRGDEDTDTHTEGRPCEHRGTRNPSTSQGQRLLKESILPIPVLTSSLQNCEKIKPCCLGHPSTLLCYGSPGRRIQGIELRNKWTHPSLTHPPHLTLDLLLKEGKEEELPACQNYPLGGTAHRTSKLAPKFKEVHRSLKSVKSRAWVEEENWHCFLSCLSAWCVWNKTLVLSSFD